MIQLIIIIIVSATTFLFFNRKQEEVKEEQLKEVNEELKCGQGTDCKTECMEAKSEFGGTSAWEVSDLAKMNAKTKFVVLNKEILTIPNYVADPFNSNKNMISNYKVKSQKFDHFPKQERPDQVKKYSCLEKCINSNIECVKLNCNNGSYKQCTNNSNLQNYYCHCKAKENCKLNDSLLYTCDKKCSNEILKRVQLGESIRERMLK